MKAIKADSKIRAGLIYLPSVSLKDLRMEHERESLLREFDAKRL
jgi:hypothetical protein